MCANKKFLLIYISNINIQNTQTFLIIKKSSATLFYILILNKVNSSHRDVTLRKKLPARSLEAILTYIGMDVYSLSWISTRRKSWKKSGEL